ncbi:MULTISPECIES: A/G-specific adenine glycosylase [unclassified Ruegeria]|uniref:A/G-specific adenine glycosylase n=1 Tax=unclassified Ruegeria TaxID=2625375 RepID=UPI001488E42C|nr:MULTISPECIES: A/G-specific adenine glycosylase [unclassified Ruegeria]
MRDSTEFDVSNALLQWYDRHAREMPWRIGPAERAAGVQPDPYRVWLSEVMLQQTTVAAVRDYFQRFTQRWPDVTALAAAPDDQVMAEWAGLGYYARARNLLKCARVVADERGGQFPNTYDELLKLPGVGPYTAAAIAAIAFDHPETVLDGNVERVMARLYDIHDPLPGSKPILKAKAEALTPNARPGDYAQAVMDMGATICTPKSPACGICVLREPCRARIAGTQSELPNKTPKQPKPTRYGHVYIALRADGALLMERRPDKGLLGGMLGWPGSDWSEAPAEAPPFTANWQRLSGEVRHTFTHFHLILQVWSADLPHSFQSDALLVIEKHAFRPSDLPTVMRKAHALWRDH